ncbi:unnamed protein product, partial [marine sediment metagenome]
GGQFDPCLVKKFVPILKEGEKRGSPISKFE